MGSWPVIEICLKMPCPAGEMEVFTTTINPHEHDNG
jgi:hypothetical protein